MSDSPEMKVITEDLEAEINIVLKELNENPQLISYSKRKSMTNLNP